MSTETLALDKHVLAYLRNVSVRETPEMVELRRETAAMPESRMQISAEQGQFMGLLIRMMGAERAIEIGSFTGYSGLCIAGALPAHGTLVACDVSVEWTDIARRYWQQAGLQERIDLRLAPGLETLASLLEEEGPESFDFVFIDAIKTEYAEYYEAALALIRPGGVIAVDNVVICAGQTSERSLETPLRERGVPVHVIGGASQASELDARRAFDQGTRLAAARHL